MTWPAIKQAFTQEQFRSYVQSLAWGGWRPSLIVWHNTAAPSLAQWKATEKSDIAAGLTPGTTRIKNLEEYFRNQQGWSGAPHLFIAQDYIWVFNPLTSPGVHSPSWNSISWGFEMVGDFDQEDDDSGDGLKVKNNGIFATAVLCEAIGLDPIKSIRLHREDPKTTHACPGEHMASDKLSMIASVLDLMSGGEHQSDIETPVSERHGTTTVGDLNIRSGPGVSNERLGSLAKNITLTILDTAKNGSTEWLRVKTPNGIIGWVAGRYIHVSMERILK